MFSPVLLDFSKASVWETSYLVIGYMKDKNIEMSVCLYSGESILKINFVSSDNRLRNKRRKSRRLAEPRDACNTTDDLELSSPHSAAERDPMLTPKQCVYVQVYWELDKVLL